MQQDIRPNHASALHSLVQHTDPACMLFDIACQSGKMVCLGNVVGCLFFLNKEYCKTGLRLEETSLRPVIGSLCTKVCASRSRQAYFEKF